MIDTQTLSCKDTRSRSFELKVIYRAPSGLKPYERNARTHSKKQISQIAASIRQFGFNNPVLISESDEIIAGHGRVLAALELGLKKVPTVQLEHLTDAERRAYILADNKLAEQAGWDVPTLKLELGELYEEELEFALEATGFETSELDILLHGDGEDEEPETVPMPEPGPAINRVGDIWQLGRHRLICGDVTDPLVIDALMGDERADCVFTDPPYNVKIDGNVCGKGSVKHREFAMASGEMSEAQFTAFLISSLGELARVSRDGAIHFVCMDWRHMSELSAAGDTVYQELKNLIVWAKTNAGMGSFYRSQHELVFVFKVGTAPHTNTFGLGETGRHRSNLWTYPGVNTFGAGQSDLALHPTVKPTALVADAIKDVTRLNQIVLDGFGGSGSTLIAAERTRRIARLVELDPHYCDVICRRFAAETGKPAMLAETDQIFDQVSAAREEEGGSHE
ncbi:MAG: site-specific DNA-methyltransferase [Hyphomonas sp.]|nr:site-specific DNA-methyltransferase [Hyphomonas sp.]